jgi:hypothetical protein
MPRLDVRTLESYLREIAREASVIPASAEVPEERLSLVPLRQVNQQSWGIDTVESYSLQRGAHCAPARLWEERVPFADEESGATKVSLDYFSDGVQRTTLLGTIPFRDFGSESVPWQMAQIGCTVLRRGPDGALAPIPDVEQIEFLLLAPISFLIAKTTKVSLRGALERLTVPLPTVRWIDTSYNPAPDDTGTDADYKVVDGQSYPRIPNEVLFRWLGDPDRFRHHGRHWATRMRDRMERSVHNALAKARAADRAEYKAASVSSLTVKDGSLRDSGGLFERSAIGLVKSLRTQYLGSDPQAVVINLPDGFRSPVFVLSRPSDSTGEAISEETGGEPPRKKSKWLSWFLRMRPQSKVDPRFGLVRIEIDPLILPSRGVRDQWKREDSLIISSVSRAVHRERMPSSYPDPRWGNLIYPMSVCEKYLRSRLVPHEVARHFGFVRLA